MKYIILIVCTCLVLGCDVPGVLRVENNSSGNALYITYQEKPNGEIERVELELSKDARKEVMFGFGQHWTDERIREYFSQIKKIELITQSDTIIMSEKKEMYKYFRKRRKGLFKQLVKIKIE